jgi:hypothetical protein
MVKKKQLPANPASVCWCNIAAHTLEVFYHATIEEMKK